MISQMFRNPHFTAGTEDFGLNSINNIKGTQRAQNQISEDR